MYTGYYPYYTNSAMPDMLGQLRGQPTQQPTQQTPQQNNNGIVWVQGEQAAKSYPVAPNNTVMLLDSENSAFYIKTTDASGMPMPLRVFDYVERVQNTASSPVSASSARSDIDLSNYVTYDQLNEILANMAQNSAPKKEKKMKGDSENG